MPFVPRCFHPTELPSFALLSPPLLASVTARLSALPPVSRLHRLIALHATSNSLHPTAPPAASAASVAAHCAAMPQLISAMASAATETTSAPVWAELASSLPASFAASSSSSSYDPHSQSASSSQQAAMLRAFAGPRLPALDSWRAEATETAFSARQAAEATLAKARERVDSAAMATAYAALGEAMLAQSQFIVAYNAYEEAAAAADTAFASNPKVGASEAAAVAAAVASSEVPTPGSVCPTTGAMLLSLSLPARAEPGALLVFAARARLLALQCVFAHQLSDAPYTPSPYPPDSKVFTGAIPSRPDILHTAMHAKWLAPALALTKPAAAAGVTTPPDVAAGLAALAALQLLLLAPAAAAAAAAAANGSGSGSGGGASEHALVARATHAAAETAAGTGAGPALQQAWQALSMWSFAFDPNTRTGAASASESAGSQGARSPLPLLLSAADTADLFALLTLAVKPAAEVRDLYNAATSTATAGAGAGANAAQDAWTRKSLAAAADASPHAQALLQASATSSFGALWPALAAAHAHTVTSLPRLRNVLALLPARAAAHATVACARVFARVPLSALAARLALPVPAVRAFVAVQTAQGEIPARLTFEPRAEAKPHHQQQQLQHEGESEWGGWGASWAQPSSSSVSASAEGDSADSGLEERLVAVDAGVVTATAAVALAAAAARAQRGPVERATAALSGHAMGWTVAATVLRDGARHSADAATMG